MSYRLNPSQDALFLDIDGTLIDFAPTPNDVVIPESLTRDLRALSQKMGGALALITGRSLANLDLVFPDWHLPAAGIHGAEWRLGVTDQVHKEDVLPETFRAHLLKAFDHPGVHSEDKGQAFTVHYREAPDMGPQIKNTLTALLESSGLPHRILPGKMVYEIVNPAFNKGMALARFLSHQPFKGRIPVFLGDDETDVFAIEECRKLGGWAERVGHGDHVFQSVGDVRAWIHQQL